MMLPGGALSAADQPKDSVRDAVQTRLVADVALGAQGVLLGHVVDEQGRPLDGATVQVTFRGSVVAQTVADQDGRFAVQGLRGGQHRIVAGKSEQIVRLWAAKTAPPSARNAALVVQGQNVVRGQLGALGGIGGVVGVAAGAAGLVTGIQAKNDADDLQDQVNTLQDQVDNIPSS
jgi:hypothetical protein